jgi:hypothetical protein
LYLVTADALIPVFGGSWRTYSCIWWQLTHLFMRLATAEEFLDVIM